MLQDNKAPKNKPLQFKRGTAKALRKANLVLLEGQPAVEIDTHKLKIGDGRTRYNLLPYIGGENKGEDGKSAYQLWKDAGFSGTVDDFLNFCIGPAGKSTYEIWLSLGNEGTMVDFINSIQGSKGDSAYNVWISEGNKGSITDFLNSLKGKSAYEIWLSLGNEGTEIEFIESLKGEKGETGDSAYDVWLSEGNEGSKEDFLNSLKGENAYECWKEEMGDPTLTPEDYINYITSTSWGSF
jgi:hypothetical protein